MRTLPRLALAAATLGAALVTPAQAYEGTDEVTVKINPPVVCVTEPCDQKPLVVVCVKRLDHCTS